MSTYIISRQRRMSTSTYARHTTHDIAKNSPRHQIRWIGHGRKDKSVEGTEDVKKGGWMTYGVTVWDEVLRLLPFLLPVAAGRRCECGNDLPERGERLVDVRALLQTLSCRACRVCTF